MMLTCEPCLLAHGGWHKRRRKPLPRNRRRWTQQQLLSIRLLRQLARRQTVQPVSLTQPHSRWRICCLAFRRNHLQQLTVAASLLRVGRKPVA